MSTNSKIAKGILQSGVTTYYSCLAQIEGSDAICGLFLSEIIHWTKKDDDQWVFRTQKEIQQSRQISKKQQRRARCYWVDNGVLEEQKKGVPARLYYKVNWDKLSSLLESLDDENGEESQYRRNVDTSSDDTEILESTKGEHKESQKVNSINAGSNAGSNTGPPQPPTESQSRDRSHDEANEEKESQSHKQSHDDEVDESHKQTHTPYKKIVEFWNEEIAEPNDLSKRLKPGALKPNIRKKWREFAKHDREHLDGDGDPWKTYELIKELIESCAFLRGDTNDWSGADFIFLFKRNDSWDKILTGFYHNHGSAHEKDQYKRIIKGDDYDPWKDGNW